MARVSTELVIPERLLKRLRDSGRPRRPMLMAVGGVMQSETARNFRTQTDPVTGATWEPPTSLTLGARAGGGGGGKTLQDTGRLLQSLTASRPQIDETSVRIGTNLPYAEGHQTGKVIAPEGRVMAIPRTRRARRAGSPRRLILGPQENLSEHFLFRTMVVIPKRRFLGINKRLVRRVVSLVARYTTATMNGEQNGGL